MSSLCKSSWIKQLLPQPLREKESQSSLATLHMPAYFSTRGHNSKLSTIFPPGPPWCWQSTNWWSLCWSGPSGPLAKEPLLCQEGWSLAEEPRPPAPIRPCADNCSGPCESPKQAKEGDRSRASAPFFTLLLRENSLMALDKPDDCAA